MSVHVLRIIARTLGSGISPIVDQVISNVYIAGVEFQ
jgi:hypothetical protein